MTRQTNGRLLPAIAAVIIPSSMDTLRTAKDLQAAGIAATQAEAIVQAIDHAITGDRVRKEDLTAALTPIRTDLAVLKWMMGFTLAALVAILTRVYG